MKSFSIRTCFHTLQWTALHTLQWTAVLITALALLQCKHAPPLEPRIQPPSFRLAVLDFAVPETWRQSENIYAVDKELKGWWFGSEKRFHNPGMGRMAADAFAQELYRLPFINMVSRSDIKYLMGDLLARLREVRSKQRRELESSLNPEDQATALKIDAMTEADYENELQKLSPVAIARELDADRVLTGRIYDAALVHKRASNLYHSFVDLEVTLIDVDTGRVLWSRRQSFKKRFASTLLVFEEAAKEMIEQMKREHFYQP